MSATYDTLRCAAGTINPHHAPVAEAGSERALLRLLFDAAVAAVDPMHCVPPHLPPPPRGRTLVLGAGKASARMALAVESVWNGPLMGLVATRYGHGEPCRQIEIVESGHPMPDAAGADAARTMLALARSMGPDDLVLALVSGGGSSLITLPAQGLSMDDLSAVNKALLLSGAPIGEMNLVRRHLSSIKGGRLADACGGATVVTLVLSDVPGDDPAVVASGPTVRDRSSAADAVEVLERRGIEVPDRVWNILRRPADQAQQGLGPRSVQVVATAQTALAAATAAAQRMGMAVVDLGGALEGESRDVAQAQAALARGLLAAARAERRPHLLLSGGETTVTVRGRGRGGRNAEFLLALALALDGEAGIHALACDTDGIDGVEDNAGGLIGPESLRQALALGLDPKALLDDNNSYAFLAAVGDLVTTGPTRTNVNDFRALLISGARS
jgi:glycerate 2-kinase